MQTAVEMTVACGQQVTVRKKILCAVLGFFLGISPSHASTGSAPFSASVNNSCILVATDTGHLEHNTITEVMSSTFTGGRSATVQATTSTAGFQVTAIPPTSFTSGNSANTTFTAFYRSSGATTLAQTTGTTASNLNQGFHVLSIDLTAVRRAGVFPRGFYTAVVTVRCE
jgi:hypothetical protein